MNLQKLNPWNWFKHENSETDDSVQIPLHREEASRSSLPTWQQPEQHPVMQLQQQIDRLFNDVFSAFGMPSRRLTPVQAGWPSSAPGIGWRPHIDVSGDDSHYEITLDVPGLSENDLSIELKEDILVISGQKGEKTEQKMKQFYRVERSYGAFQRTLSLPADATADDIKASLKDGVLTLMIPRDPAARSDVKRIAISSP